ncbi:MAG TPA: cysteine synthase family protein [Fervidobacterium sp.]|nr:cysteine synthase family protein [Fervidobacterium sp.]HPT53448.1 cysteine synthase family protein [Fervidobacterium sp.]
MKENVLMKRMQHLAIGNTPIVYLEEYGVYAKLERNNPSGSVKDRPVYFMVIDAINRGKIDEKTIIVEATSGNTGISLAWIGAQLGLKVILTMPESVSVERRKVLQGLGADLVLVENMSKAVEKAEEIVEAKDAFMLNQFDNPSNPLAHELTTGPEILRQMNYNVDGFIAGVGTGGTITGTGKALKKFLRNKVKVVALEPKQSPVLSGGYSGLHMIQGIGAGFIPKVLDSEIIDEIVQIDDGEALEMTKKLWKKGIFVGISSATNLLGAIYVREKYRLQKVVTIFCDDGFKYLSSF